MTFLKELEAHAATLTAKQKAEIQKRVKTPFNRQLRAMAAPEELLGKLTPFEFAFLDRLHPQRFEKLRKVAQRRMQSYLGRGSRVEPKLQQLVLPKPDSQDWELTFCESFTGPVVYFLMKGWKASPGTLVG